MPKKKKVVATMDMVTRKKIKNHKKLGDTENEVIEYKNKRKTFFRINFKFYDWN